MSRNVPLAIQLLLNSGATQLATCWKCTRKDEQVFGFTDHDAPLVVDSVPYSASTGYTRSAIQAGSTLAVDNLNLDGMLDASEITLEDLRSGKWDFCEVELFLVVWSNTSLGSINLGYGTLGEVQTNGRSFVAELLGITQRLQQQVGRIYGLGCDADVFDARCGLVAATYQVSGTLTSVTNRRQMTDSARTEADGYFDRGVITFTSGANIGLSMEIKTWSSDTFLLQLPMPFSVAISDAYTALPGCPKTPEACKTKFLTNNIVNYRGFMFLPGSDRIISGGL